MCRLLAMNIEECDYGSKLLFFHQLMLYNLADGNQIDGAGVSDGDSIVKSGDPYNLYGLEMARELKNGKIWMGHVRKASRGTDPRSTLASHPFFYPRTGLIGAHNGFITEMEEDELEHGPDVDSYRALSKLSSIIEEDGVITPNLISRWIEGFGPGSEWSFILSHKGVTWVVCGIRPIYCLNINNGTVYSTSFNALHGVRLWCKTFYPNIYKFKGDIHAIKTHKAIRVQYGEKDIEYILKGRERPYPQRLVYHVDNGEERMMPIE